MKPRWITLYLYLSHISAFVIKILGWLPVSPMDLFNDILRNSFTMYRRDTGTFDSRSNLSSAQMLNLRCLWEIFSISACPSNKSLRLYAMRGEDDLNDPKHIQSKFKFQSKTSTGVKGSSGNLRELYINKKTSTKCSKVVKTWEPKYSQWCEKAHYFAISIHWVIALIIANLPEYLHQLEPLKTHSTLISVPC